ncbi:hypothetical protein KGV55_02780 [Candidatus Gracilibacteria bacterium]|nr:hypothetical protein [Candidatus Gracilibacteria bacterium]
MNVSEYLKAILPSASVRQSRHDTQVGCTGKNFNLDIKESSYYFLGKKKN